MECLVTPSPNDTRPTIPARADYGGGCYRRAIALEAAPGEVRGELADDFHHFAVRITHGEGLVRSVGGEPIRVPWTTCPSALVPLRRLEGAAISLPLRELTRLTPAREQCTHWYDLACLAIAHAARVERGGEETRRYDVEMPDRVDRITTCALSCDDTPQLRWRIEGMRISDADGPTFLGTTIGRRDFRSRLDTLTDPDAFEAAWILQRACFIGLGRQHDFEAMQTAEAFGAMVGGSCHTYSPQHMAAGLRNTGTVRDFSALSRAPLRADETVEP